MMLTRPYIVIVIDRVLKGKAICGKFINKFRVKCGKITENLKVFLPVYLKASYKDLSFTPGCT